MIKLRIKGSNLLGALFYMRNINTVYSICIFSQSLNTTPKYMGPEEEEEEEEEEGEEEEGEQEEEDEEGEEK